MTDTQLCTIVSTDFSAVTRGRAIAAAQFDAHAETGVGWLQANLALLPDGRIASPNVWGSAGDLRLLPDQSARYVTSDTGAPTPFDIAMADIVTPEGKPWPGCTRTMLRDALADLEKRTGLRMIAAFEHEFQLFDVQNGVWHPLSLAALRTIDPLGPRLVGALKEAGVEPEAFIAEFGRQQFEISCAPAEGVAAADRAVAVREVTREIAIHLGRKVSFSPKTTPDSVGNGVHIHFSFMDTSGKPATYDADGPGRLSATAAAFCAGVLEHQAALLAFTAPSPISYLRLRPGSWSAAYRWWAVQDREASLRICPVVTMAGREPEGQFNIEYRPADALANPYLALAALVLAGLDGIEGQRTLPPRVSAHPDQLSDEARCAAGIARLPTSLDEALAALETSTIFRDWLAGDAGRTYLAVRRAEIETVRDFDDDALCAFYRERY